MTFVDGRIFKGIYNPSSQQKLRGFSSKCVDQIQPITHEMNPWILSFSVPFNTPWRSKIFANAIVFKKKISYFEAKYLGINPLSTKSFWKFRLFS